jgi:predicted  nucleic acid-binding Zn-ribbon protein
MGKSEAAVSLVNYVKTAFLNRWNLLAFLGASGFALLSGHVDVALPLVAAAEIGFLGLLASHPKFQQHVDAQAAKAARQQVGQAHEQSLLRITRSLPRESLARFEALRAKCLELRQIAGELRNPGLPAEDLGLEQFQVAGLDRLLWVYLRLLYTQFALARFLQQTGKESIERTISQLEKRLAAVPANQQGGSNDRMKKALEDNLQTNRDRLANWNKARDNYQLVELEIDRLENKIRSLSEMAVNRQEPEFISSQVDQVATSMLQTEKTMNELQFATGLEALDETAPELLKPKTRNTQ